MAKKTDSRSSIADDAPELARRYRARAENVAYDVSVTSIRLLCHYEQLVSIGPMNSIFRIVLAIKRNAPKFHAIAEPTDIELRSPTALRRRCPFDNCKLSGHPHLVLLRVLSASFLVSNPAELTLSRKSSQLACGETDAFSRRSGDRFARISSFREARCPVAFPISASYHLIAVCHWRAAFSAMRRARPSRRFLLV